MMTQPQDEPNRSEPESAPAEDAKKIPARDLFEGRREVLIEHEGECYRLRITRRNRLILQK